MHQCTASIAQTTMMRKTSSFGDLASAHQHVHRSLPGSPLQPVARRVPDIPRPNSMVKCRSYGSLTAAAAAAAAGAAPVQQQQQVVSSEASIQAGPSRAQAAPFASLGLTRVLFVGSQPSALVRNLAARKWRGAGPVSLLLFLLGLMLGVMASIRGVLARSTRSCKCCRGYGIVRCQLCNGEGAVEWRGKNNHQETCPLCMTKRFVTCPECGGHYHKKMFVHIKPASARAGVPDFLAS